jgi:hypothetical protein
MATGLRNLWLRSRAGPEIVEHALKVGTRITNWPGLLARPVSLMMTAKTPEEPKVLIGSYEDRAGLHGHEWLHE